MLSLGQNNNYSLTLFHKEVKSHVEVSLIYDHVEVFTSNVIIIKTKVFVTTLTRQVLLVEQELFTLPEHLSPLPIFSGIRVTRSLVLCVCFVDRCLSCIFFFLPLCCLFFFDFLITSLWYLQTLPIPTLKLSCLYQARTVSGYI